MNLIVELKRRLDEANLWQNEIELKRNDFLTASGKSNGDLYFVVEGSLRIFIYDESNELTIRFGYAGDFITALDAFITNKPSEYNIQALKKCKLKVIDKATYLSFIQNSPSNMELWNSMLLLLLHMHLEREKDILISSPLERYNRVLKRSPHLFQEIPHKYIASYLRMTPETLSRLKKS